MQSSDQCLDLKAFFGHHKCGSQWASKIFLAFARHQGQKTSKVTAPKEFDNDLAEFCRRRQVAFLAYTNADYGHVRELSFHRAIHLIRDPRDLCVSAYFSHLHSHPVKGWPELRAHRAILKRLPFDEGLLADMEFNQPYLTHLGTWEYGNPKVLEARFEDIVHDQGAIFFHRAAAFLLFDMSHHGCAMDSLVKSNTFRHLSGGRERGHADTHSHYRTGMIGDWRNHFNERHIQYFKAVNNWVLVATGYEKDEDWS